VAPHCRYVLTYFFTNTSSILDPAFIHLHLFSFLLLDSFSNYLSSKYQFYLAYLRDPASRPASIPESSVTELFYQLNLAGEYLNHFMTPLIRLMSAIIHEYGSEGAATFAQLLVVFFCSYAVLLFLMYILVLYPIAKSLSIDAAKTKSLMVMLPPDVVKHVFGANAANSYIQDNLSLE